MRHSLLASCNPCNAPAFSDCPASSFPAPAFRQPRPGGASCTLLPSLSLPPAASMPGDAQHTEAEAAAAYGQAAAALLAATAAAPPPPADPSPEAAQQAAALAACLEEQAAEAEAELERQAQRQEALRRQIGERCSEAEGRHEEVAGALSALADRLACLSAPGAANAQHPRGARLLCLDLPDSYAAACRSLLDNLAGYLQHNFPAAAPGSTGGSASSAAAQQQHQAAAAELAQLQECAVKAARLRVEEEAELARLQAELQVLQAGSATAPAASLGYSAADLEAEVASLQRRQADSLAAAAQAAAAAAAAAAGAGVVQEQAEQRRAQLEQRQQAKQQVAAVLTRHLARQLLVLRLLQNEQAAVQEVKAAVAAARQDAELALQAAEQRLAKCQAGDSQGQPCSQSTGSKAVAPGEPQQQQQPGQEQGQQDELPSDPVATASQLLACRQQLQALSEQLHAETLPAHRAVFAQLHGLLYSGGGGEGDADAGSGAGEGAHEAGGKLELSPAALQEQLAAVAEAEAALSLQANALLEEVLSRQQAPAERQLAERVLHDFWSRPQQLAALADKQRRQLATYAAG